MLRGAVFQFAEGRYPDEIGTGIAVNEEAFDLIAPVLFAFCAGWTAMHRFGVYEMPSDERLAIAGALNQAAAEHQKSGVTTFEVELFAALADWLKKHANPTLVVSVLGI